jgi:hypothetical protein
MHRRLHLWTLAIVMVVVGSAQGKAGLDGGLGYAQLSFDEGGGDNLSGWGPAFRLWFSGADSENGLRLFLGLHSTNYPGDMDEDAIWDVWIFTPEAGLAWHQPLAESGLFLEPCVSGGAVISTYKRRGSDLLSYYVGEDDNAVGWVVRPGLLLGYETHDWGFGAEISYGLQNIEFTSAISGTHSELYLGFFGRLTW